MDLPEFENFYLKSLSDTDLSRFQCDPKLQDFFTNDAIDSEEELITKTYFLHHKDIEEPLVGFSLSNNAIEACSELDMSITSTSHYRVYPAVLIGRLATHLNHTGKYYGIMAIDLIKSWFITNNKTGCRFLIVDSRSEATSFYEKCGFEMYPEQRKDSKTELLFFDLKAFELELNKRYGA